MRTSMQEDRLHWAGGALPEVEVGDPFLGETLCQGGCVLLIMTHSDDQGLVVVSCPVATERLGGANAKASAGPRPTTSRR